MDGIIRRREMVNADGGGTKPQGWLYHFNGDVISSGTRDFGLSGDEVFSTGVYGQAFVRRGADDSGGTQTFGIKATGLQSSDLPYFDTANGGTISFWAKSFTNLRGHIFSAQKRISTSYANYTNYQNAANIKSGWSVTRGAIPKSYDGIRLNWESQKLYVRIMNYAKTVASAFIVTPPSSFDSTQWHHYAMTTDSSYFRFFIDGEQIFRVSTGTILRFSDQFAIGGVFDTTVGSTNVASVAYGIHIDDFYIAEFCKWSADFDPTTIVY